MTFDELQNRIEIDKVVALLYFSLKGCGPCMVFKPTLERVVERHPHAQLIILPAEQNETLLDRFNIMAFPTTVAMKGGKEIARFRGGKVKHEIEALLEEHTP